ncbi:unnamed protein product, partial [Darwinula stevensoni]
MYQGLQPGGQLTITTEVENYPGYPEGVMGPQMMKDFEAQAQRMGADIRWGMASKVDFSTRPFKVEIDEEKWVEADSVIIATGASAKWLGLESEQRLNGYGVSACAVCDGTTMKLRIGMIEHLVYTTPPGSNGEKDFHNVVREMYPDAAGTTIPNAWTVVDQDAADNVSTSTVTVVSTAPKAIPYSNDFEAAAFPAGYYAYDSDGSGSTWVNGSGGTDELEPYKIPTKDKHTGNNYYLGMTCKVNGI